MTKCKHENEVVCMDCNADMTIKEMLQEARADERAKLNGDERLYDRGYREGTFDGYKKGQADLIEKLRLDIGRMKKSLLEDMAYTGGKGGKNYAEQMGKYFDGYNRAIDDIIKYRLASESVALRGNKPPISAEISGSLGANALSLVSGGKRVITTPKPEKPSPYRTMYAEPPKKVKR